VALFTSHATWRAALTSYRRRWAIEGSFRDAQGGWDGRHGWDLEPVLGRQPTAQRAAALVGLWALGTLAQSWLGDRVGRADAPAAVRGAVAGWTTTGRLSVWARGQLALREGDPALGGWLRATLAAGADRLAAPGTPPDPAPRLRPLPPPPRALPAAA
jgi:hypothetical protein